jgi:hypothetical protein
VDELFQIVARWIVVFLVAVPVGSLGPAVGHRPLAIACAAVLILAGTVFVWASTIANTLFVGSRLGRHFTPEDHAALHSLVGPGLNRATLVGFGGAGMLAGALSPSVLVGVIAGVAAVVAAGLTGRHRPSDR